MTKNFVAMDIRIWNNKYANRMFDYKNEKENPNDFKKIYFNLGNNDKNCFLIKTNNNYIISEKEHKEFNSNRGDEILFRIRESLKIDSKYEVINPIKPHNIYSREVDDFLNDKIWFPVRSIYFEGNNKNYKLNLNDVIKIGKKKYIINKLHFAYEEKCENINDDDFNKKYNISYVSIINKKSKSIFIINIKSNKFKISNKKNYYKKLNEINKENQINKEEEVNEVNEINEVNDINDVYEINEVKEVNYQKFKNSNQNINENNLDFKNKTISTNNNINNSIITKQSNQNNSKNIINQNTSQKTTKKETSNLQNENGNENDSHSENEFDKCWLCLISFSSIDNPLICLCDCHNYIHFECLKMYLTSKITVTQNLKRTVTTYTCEKFNCDICLKPYQLRFRIPEIDRTYELIDLNLPEETDYFCMESLDYIKNKNNIKTVHIVQLIDEEINIGRNNYNDIIDTDISVSRDHAVIKYNKNNRNLFLENKDGKYGTLILVRGNIEVKEEKTYFQIGNTKISMELTNKKKFNPIDKESSNIILYNSKYENYIDSNNDNDKDNDNNYSDNYSDNDNNNNDNYNINDIFL